MGGIILFAETINAPHLHGTLSKNRGSTIFSVIPAVAVVIRSFNCTRCHSLLLE